MARIGNQNRGLMFTRDAARRIARAVQAYEHGNRSTTPPKIRTAYGDESDPIRIARVPEDWSKGDVLEVELVYETDCEEEGGGSGSEGETLEARNDLFDIAEGSLVWLALALNGCWYVVAVACSEEGSGSGDCGCLAIAGQDLRTLPGYSDTGTQLLGHVDGCLQWISTTECGSGSEGEGEGGGGGGGGGANTPSAPQSFAILDSALNDGVAEYALEWIAPASDGGSEITGYTLEYNLAGSSGDDPGELVQPDENDPGWTVVSAADCALYDYKLATIDPMTEDDFVYFRISATNENGTGEYAYAYVSMWTIGSGGNVACD